MEDEAFRGPEAVGSVLQAEGTTEERPRGQCGAVHAPLRGAGWLVSQGLDRPKATASIPYFILRIMRSHQRIFKKR